MDLFEHQWPIIRQVILFNCNKDLCLEIADIFIKKVLTYLSFNFSRNTLIETRKFSVSAFKAFDK